MTLDESSQRHLVHSHAKECDVPGTVDLRAVEGDDTAYGQALYPVPAEDPNDPLQWSGTKKTLILIVCSLYSFFSVSTLEGPSVYIRIYAREFGVSNNRASCLISYAHLAYGFSSIIMVPLYHRIGRRPVMLGSLIIYCAGLIGASQSHSYASLMACRVLHGFGSGICEALPVQLVNDIFFLHERGKRLGYYTFCMCLGSTGPLYAGYMLAGGRSWRLFFLVELAFGAALLVLAFFVVEETAYKRNVSGDGDGNDGNDGNDVRIVDMDTEKHHHETLAGRVSTTMPPERKTFLATLKFWGTWNGESDFFLMMARALTYYLVPQVFWVVATYGIYIGLGALTFNYIFPIKITAPPYNWSETSSGLIALASLLGYLLALPFTPLSDVLAARLTRRNGGIREAEMRLGVMLPVVLLSPAGIVLFGFSAERDLPWIAYFAGVVMNQFASYFFFTFVLTYAIDSYTANISEMLIAINLGKQAVSFGMGLDLLEWVQQHGYAVMIAGAFGSIVLANNLAVIIFMVFGKRIRTFMSGTWLARIHRSTVHEVATH